MRNPLVVAWDEVDGLPMEALLFAPSALIVDEVGRVVQYGCGGDAYRLAG